MREILITNNNQKLPRASYYVEKDGKYNVGAVNYTNPENILNENKITSIKKLIPGTYEELKEILLNKYSNNKNYIIKVNKESGDIYLDNTFKKYTGNSLTIAKQENGIIIYDLEWAFAHNRTPEQALNIIENLMD